jgi:hypothetical protein
VPNNDKLCDPCKAIDEARSRSLDDLSVDKKKNSTYFLNEIFDPMQHIVSRCPLWDLSLGFADGRDGQEDRLLHIVFVYFEASNIQNKPARLDKKKISECMIPFKQKKKNIPEQKMRSQRC